MFCSSFASEIELWGYERFDCFAVAAAEIIGRNRFLHLLVVFTELIEHGLSSLDVLLHGFVYFLVNLVTADLELALLIQDLVEAPNEFFRGNPNVHLTHWCTGSGESGTDWWRDLVSH